MKKNYRELKFLPCESIEQAIKELARYKKTGELVCGEFNGKKLYSDIDDIDSAYKKITGKTKTKFDAKIKADNDRYKEEERKHKEAIPELTKKWIEKGAKIIDKKYLKLWNKCVPIRLDDLYQGMELGNCLDIVKALNKGCDLKVAKAIIEKQGHSGMSFGLTCSMVRSFCDRGLEFVNFVK